MNSVATISMFKKLHPRVTVLMTTSLPPACPIQNLLITNFFPILSLMFIDLLDCAPVPNHAWQVLPPPIWLDVYWIMCFGHSSPPKFNWNSIGLCVLVAQAGMEHLLGIHLALCSVHLLRDLSGSIFIAHFLYFTVCGKK
jgi:hypothetical protein